MKTDEQLKVYYDLIIGANFYVGEYVRLIFRGEDRAERAKLILTPFIGREIEIREVSVELPIDSVGGRGIRMDVCAVDESGSTFDVEFQRDVSGAHPHRARFNSPMIDAHYPIKGVATNELRLPETYVLFFTEKDHFKKGKAFYRIDRMILDINEPFDDGSHIIYINGEFDDTSTRAGQIIHDLRTARAGDMIVPEMAHWTRDLKETKEGENMVSDEFAKMIANIKNDLREEMKNDIKEEIFQKAMQQGIQQGMLSGLYNLVNRGRLTSKDAAEEANMPVSVFIEKMKEYNAGAHA